MPHRMSRKGRGRGKLQQHKGMKKKKKMPRKPSTGKTVKA